MLLQNGDRIVFTGDSTTDAGRARPVGEGLHQGVGDGYVRQSAIYFITDYMSLETDWDAYLSMLDILGQQDYHQQKAKKIICSQDGRTTS